MFEIKQGLFQFEFVDNHAILGVHVDAEFDEIRKRYMRLARRLHPDTCPFKNSDEKELAKELLAKLVSPAYNHFSKENERKEYALLLKTIGDRAVKEQHTLILDTEAAQQLLKTTDYQKTYLTLLEKLAQEEYESPAQALEKIAEISELNLAYLVRKNQGGAVPPPPPQNKDKELTPTPAKKDSFVEQACNRAEKFIASQNYDKAVAELRDALKREPDNSRCHGLLGLAYLKQNQPKLANPHVKRALQLDPKQPNALDAQKQLQAGTSHTGAKASKSASTAKKPENPSGGLFGGLFGGKKK